MAIIETSDDGGLHLPPDLIGEARPHAKYELEVVGGGLFLRPAEKDRPFWRFATPQQRAEAFRKWANAARPATPNLTDESLRREHLYD